MENRSTFISKSTLFAYIPFFQDLVHKYKNTKYDKQAIVLKKILKAIESDQVFRQDEINNVHNFVKKLKNHIEENISRVSPPNSEHQEPVNLDQNSEKENRENYLRNDQEKDIDNDSGTSELLEEMVERKPVIIPVHDLGEASDQIVSSDSEVPLAVRKSRKRKARKLPSSPSTASSGVKPKAKRGRIKPLESSSDDEFQPTTSAAAKRRQSKSSRKSIESRNSKKSNTPQSQASRRTRTTSGQPSTPFNKNGNIPSTAEVFLLKTGANLPLNSPKGMPRELRELCHDIDRNFDKDGVLTAERTRNRKALNYQEDKRVEESSTTTSVSSSSAALSEEIYDDKASSQTSTSSEESSDEEGSEEIAPPSKVQEEISPSTSSARSEKETLSEVACNAENPHDDDSYDDEDNSPIKVYRLEDFNSKLAIKKLQEGLPKTVKIIDGKIVPVHRKDSTESSKEEEQNSRGYVISTPSKSSMISKAEQSISKLSYLRCMGGYQYKCSYETCSIYYTDRETFKNHVLLRHSDLKWDGQCQICKRSVSSGGSLILEFQHLLDHINGRAHPRQKQTARKHTQKRLSFNETSSSIDLNKTYTVSQENVADKPQDVQEINQVQENLSSIEENSEPQPQEKSKETAKANESSNKDKESMINSKRKPSLTTPDESQKNPKTVVDGQKDANRRVIDYASTVETISESRVQEKNIKNPKISSVEEIPKEADKSDNSSKSGERSMNKKADQTSEKKDVQSIGNGQEKVAQVEQVNLIKRSDQAKRHSHEKVAPIEKSDKNEKARLQASIDKALAQLNEKPPHQNAVQKYVKSCNTSTGKEMSPSNAWNEYSKLLEKAATTSGNRNQQPSKSKQTSGEAEKSPSNVQQTTIQRSEVERPLIEIPREQQKEPIVVEKLPEIPPSIPKIKLRRMSGDKLSSSAANDNAVNATVTPPVSQNLIQSVSQVVPRSVIFTVSASIPSVTTTTSVLFSGSVAGNSSLTSSSTTTTPSNVSLRTLTVPPLHYPGNPYATQPSTARIVERRSSIATHQPLPPSALTALRNMLTHPIRRNSLADARPSPLVSNNQQRAPFPPMNAIQGRPSIHSAAPPTPSSQTIPQRRASIAFDPQQVSGNVQTIALLTLFPVKIKLSPWFTHQSPTCKSANVITKMLKDDCLKNLYKCMCPDCYFSTSDQAEFQSHIADEIGRKKCCYCPFETDKSAELPIHISKEHGSCTTACGLCFYRSVNIFQTKMHMEKYHPGEKKGHISFTVTNYPKIDRNADIEKAKENRKNTVTAIICPGCCSKFFNINAFKLHFQQKHASSCERLNVKCKTCQTVIKTFDEMINVHLSNCHKIRQFHCVRCTSFSTTTIDEMKYHLCDVHPDVLPLYCDRNDIDNNYQQDSESYQSTCVYLFYLAEKNGKTTIYHQKV